MAYKSYFVKGRVQRYKDNWKPRGSTPWQEKKTSFGVKVHSHTGENTFHFTSWSAAQNFDRMVRKKKNYKSSSFLSY